MLAFVVVALVAATCSSSNEAGTDAGPLSTDAPTSLLVGDVGRIDIADSGFAGAGQLVVERAPAPSLDEISLPFDVLAVGEGLDVDLTGDPEGSFEVELTLPPRPTDDALPIALRRSDEGSWETVVGRWDPDAGTLTVNVEEFSSWFPSWLNPVNWVAGLIDGIADFVTGRTDPPHCNNDPPPWASISPAGSTAHTCLQSNVDAETGDVRVEVLFKSNRRSFLAADIPHGVDYAWVEDQSDWLRPILAWFTGEDSDRHVLLPGGDQYSFGFEQPEFNQDVHIVILPTPGTIILDGVFSVLGLVGASPEEWFTSLFGIAKCLGSVAGIDIYSFDLTPEFDLRTIFGALLDCVFDLVPTLTDAGFAADFLGDLEANGVVEFTATGRQEALDSITKGSRSLGAALSKINKAIAFATVGFDVYDKIVDNAGFTFQPAVLTMLGTEVTDPQPGDFDIDLGGVAIGAGPQPIYFVLDTSGSMADPGDDGSVKLETAKGVVRDFAGLIEPDQPTGLWTYPAPVGGNCNPGYSRVPLGTRDFSQIIAVSDTLSADGSTPTAEAIRAVVADYQQAGYDRGTLLLITDGESKCDDPCQAARDILATGFLLEVKGIAYATTEARTELDCLSEVTNGASIYAGDEEALARAVDSASRPTLSVELDFERSLVADVGVGAGAAEITATVHNTSETDARNVIVRLDFATTITATISPVRALGNLGPGEEASVTWRFPASLDLAGRTVEFDVIAGAANTDEQSVQAGAIQIIDASTRDDAGDILDWSNVVIMGDSYTAGEGADDYLPGTNDALNGCHRSLDTYLVDEWELDATQILACSGAVTRDLYYSQSGNLVDSQLQQLRDYSSRPAGPPNAVVMTMGGNDAGFGALIKACILATDPCSENVDKVSSQEFFDTRLGALEVGITETNQDDPQNLIAALVHAYRAIDGVLNSRAAVGERGTTAPILIPAYPLAVPRTDQPCLSLLTIDQSELNYVQKFATGLNARVEAATAIAREHFDVPVWFVSTTEDVFQPNHSICDREPWARGLESFNGSGLDLRLAFLSPAAATVEAAQRALQELFHPNDLGYDAISRGIVRWTLTDEAAAAEQFLIDATPANPEIVRTWDASEVVLGPGSGPQALQIQGPTGVTVQGGGFLPSSSVDLRVESTPVALGQGFVDTDGNVSVDVILPSLPVGDHTVILTGVGDDAEPRVVEIAITVSEPDTLPREFVFLGVAALFLIVGLVALFIERRRAVRP